METHLARTLARDRGWPCPSVRRALGGGHGPVDTVVDDRMSGGSLVEQLFDNPFTLAVIVAVALLFLGRLAFRWRRESALHNHAEEHGWKPIDNGDAFADLVMHRFPEVRDQAEQDARSARRSGAKRGRGPGVNVSLTSSAGARSRSRARSAYLVPVENGEFAAGDVAVTGTTGKLSQGRSTVRRAAVAAGVPEEMPALKLISRTWIDRDTGGSLPEQLRARFNDVELDEQARGAYLDSGAWQTLLDAPEETDGIAIDNGRVVVLSRKQLTPQRAQALADTARRFVAEAATTEAGDGFGPRLTDPLSSR